MPPESVLEPIKLTDIIGYVEACYDHTLTKYHESSSREEETHWETVSEALLTLHGSLMTEFGALESPIDLEFSDMPDPKQIYMAGLITGVRTPAEELGKKTPDHFYGEWLIRNGLVKLPDE